MRPRANALAVRLEEGARALSVLANALTDAEWQTRVPKDGRRIGVVVHHVATMYPLEIQLAQTLAGGKAVAGVTWDAVHEINAAHAKEFDAVTKQAALDLLRTNSAAAAAAIRALSAGVAQRRCAAHMPVLPRGSRGAAQLSSRRQDPIGVAALTISPPRPWLMPSAACGAPRYAP